MLSNRIDALKNSVPPELAQGVAHVEQLSRALRLGDANPGEATRLATHGPSVQKVMKHTTKGARRRTLQPEIEHAQSLCKNEWDSAAVWGALQKMAESKYGQLIGATEDGLQYLKSGDVKIFTRDALGKRLKNWKKNHLINRQ